MSCFVRFTVCGLLGLLLLASTGGLAQEATGARQNIEYRLIPPQPVETGERIEVIDFFWYGCPYCNALLPVLEEWHQRKPPDVALRRVPAILRDTWSPHARIYYTLEVLGEVDRLHDKVYHGYHVRKLHMSKPDVMVEWAVSNGIDRKRWLDAYFSPEVDTKVEQAARLTHAYTVEGTPSLVVDGRYLTSGAMAPSLKGMIPVLDDLVRLARAQRSRR
jgi:protein dithiol oxidoreductase (disulfide-forming)